VAGGTSGYQHEVGVTEADSLDRGPLAALHPVEGGVAMRASRDSLSVGRLTLLSLAHDGFLSIAPPEWYGLR